MNTCTWPLGNDQTLNFTICKFNDNWNKVAGLYIFAKKTDATHWSALYVGQTDDFSSRIPSHEKWDSATQRGATHVHAAVIPQQASRDTWEKRLIAHLQPPLNEHYTGLRYKQMSG